MGLEWVFGAVMLGSLAICASIAVAAKSMAKALEERLPLDDRGYSEALLSLWRIERQLEVMDHRASGGDMDEFYERLQKRDERDSRRKCPWLYVDEETAN